MFLSPRYFEAQPVIPGKAEQRMFHFVKSGPFPDTRHVMRRRRQRRFVDQAPAHSKLQLESFSGRAVNIAVPHLSKAH